MVCIVFAIVLLSLIVASYKPKCIKKLLMRKLLLFSLIPLLISCAQERNKQYVKNEAYLAAFNQNFHEALVLYNELIDMDSQDAESYLNRSKIYIQLEDYNSSMVDLNSALELNPDDSRILNAMAFIENNTGDAVKALRHLEQALSNIPDYYDAQLQRGTIRSSQGDLLNALYDFDQLILRDSLNCDLYINRGVISYTFDCVEWIFVLYEQYFCVGKYISYALWTLFFALNLKKVRKSVDCT